MKNSYLTIGITLITAVLLTSCSALEKLSTSKTDRLKRGEFYKTYEANKFPNASSTIGLLPITVQPSFDSFDEDYDSDNPKLIELTDSITAKIQRMPISLELISGYDLINSKNAPGIYVGSSEGDKVPYGASVQMEEDEVVPPMIIHMKKPKDEWKAQAANAALEYGTDYFLRIWVSFAEYPKVDKGLIKKQVLLGTNYSKEIRFLSDDLKPVEVLQISGYLADKNGNVLRAGAEGIIHNDTRVWLQMLDVKELIDDETVRRVLYSEQRDDLPGDPLTLDVAIKNLVAQLLDRDI
tara:strand:- start:65764 stop:66648 length:885 start_codon:yes stop_codon:yes gene_type:complete